MKSITLFTITLFMTINGFSQQFQALLFTKAVEYEHAVTPAAVEAIKELGKKHFFKLDISSYADDLLPEQINNYQVVIFLNNSGDVMNEKQQNSLKNFIENGGGFVGIHGATIAENNWEWYGKLIGRFFTGHPKIQTAEIKVINQDFPATYHLPKKWVWTDEWYEFTPALSENLEVLLTVDETTYNPVFESKGKEFKGMGAQHPIAWFQEVGKGRMFYTALGHLEKAWSDPMFLQHIYGGIYWASQSAY